MFNCSQPNLNVVRSSFPQCIRAPAGQALRTAIILGTLFWTANSAALEISVTGVDGALQRNILTYIGKPIDDTPEEIDEFVSSIKNNADKAMQAVGYYNSSYAISRNDTGSTPALTIDVNAGKPVLITKLSIAINGDARLDGDYMPIIGKIPVGTGAVFTHRVYEETKSVLIDAALDRGYFDYTFTTSEVRVSRKNSSAEITLVADSGFRYTFADITFKSDYFSSAFLQRYVPFKTGDYFESKMLASLTQQMQNTGFFSTVKVVPKRGPLYGKQVPVFIDVERKQKNYIGVGLGFATDTLWRTKLTWSKPVINLSGHSFESALSLSKDEQDVSFAFRIPRSKNPLTNYWSLEYGLQNQDQEPKSFLNTVNVQHIRQARFGWRESLFVRWERERSEVSGVTDETDLFLPGVNYSKSNSSGLPWPTKGYNVNVQLMYGSRHLLSDIDLLKSSFNYKVLKSFGERNTVILTLQYGAISSNDFDRVPVSQRFFAGGDRSIRGFSYRSVAPLDDEGNAVGGRFLEVGSAEYSYRFKPRWAGALFVDAGRAFNEKDEPVRVGAGAGIRWYSPVGPFRLDLAYDVSEDNPSLSYHLSLGPDL